jgi:hypothetical protein
MTSVNPDWVIRPPRQPRRKVQHLDLLGLKPTIDAPQPALDLEFETVKKSPSLMGSALVTEPVC